MRARLITLATIGVLWPCTISAQRAWVEARSPNAIVISDSGADTARRIAGDLEEIRHLMRHVVGDAAVEPGEPVVILAVNGSRGMRELLPQSWERRGPKPAAAASPGPYTPYIAIRADLSAGRRRRFLFHEYVHLLTRNTIEELPAWLDEGLSEFWSALAVRDNGLEVGRSNGGHVSRLNNDRWIPLAELLSRPRGEYRGGGSRVAMQYAQSWALVHYLLLDRNPAAPILFAPAGDPAHVPNLEPILRQLAHSNAFRTRRAALPPPYSGPVIAVRALSEADSAAWRGAFLVHGERPDAAKPLLKKALEIDGSNPIALEGMGTACFRLNEPDQARQWFSRATALESVSYRSHYYYAVLLHSQAPAEARRHLEAALALRPGFQPAVERLKNLTPDFR
jgi:hypothetical protein